MQQREQSRGRAQQLGLGAGPALGVLVYLLLPQAYPGMDGAPVELGHPGRATAGVAVWMATWWFTEAIPVYATALLPLVLLPLLRAATMKAAAAPYAHELIFLFMGGFLLALAMERWGLHRRIALTALRVAGDRPVHVVGAFMAVSAGLSMWVSNTATAIMMLPVALSVIELVAQGSAPGEPHWAPGSPVRSFAIALLLGIAYAASIGGVATPIGTPPNLFLLSYVQEHLDREISFVRWMALSLPLVALFLPITWLLLTRVLHPVRLPRIEGGPALVGQALRDLGPMSRGERIVLGVFLLTSGLWITRPLLTGIELAGIRPLAGLTDAGIAMLAALLLFVAPVDRRAGTFALDWDTAVKLPWGILILFGGGLSLAAAIQQNGVAELIGSQASAFAGVPSWITVLAVVAGIIFLTELTSNTATTAALVPVLATVAPGLGFDPLLLVVPAAVSASCAFMLPVATPPNAVIFGSGLVRIPDMVQAGFWLNLIGIALVTLFTYAVAMPVLGVR
jgi:sodium-dependent dicarboxylate transporter 2/3/5